MTPTPRPRDPNEPLPLTLPNLDHVPAEYHAHYSDVPEWDGTRRLQWIREDDYVSKLAHTDAIAAGNLNVMPAGETPAALAALRKRGAVLAAALRRDMHAQFWAQHPYPW